jgi:hypothetical protein
MAQYLTPDEASKMRPRHPESLRRAARAGDLHAIHPKKRGHWLIDIDCLDAYLAGEPCKHRTSNVVDLASKRSA